MDDINNYIKSIQESNLPEDKAVKVARLIILLTKIEKELTTVKQTLVKLEQHQSNYNPSGDLINQIKEKQATVDRLTAKIQKARLNLNFYYI